jgi:hypothetical protein
MLLMLRAAPLSPPRDFAEALEQASSVAAARTDQRFADRERAMLEQLRRDVDALTPRVR